MRLLQSDSPIEGFIQSLRRLQGYEETELEQQLRECFELDDVSFAIAFSLVKD